MKLTQIPTKECNFIPSESIATFKFHAEAPSLITFATTMATVLNNSLMLDSRVFAQPDISAHNFSGMTADAA